MIVRILGQGQLSHRPCGRDELNALDAKVEAAVNGSDEEAFTDRVLRSAGPDP